MTKVRYTEVARAAFSFFPSLFTHFTFAHETRVGDDDEVESGGVKERLSSILVTVHDGKKEEGKQRLSRFYHTHTPSQALILTYGIKNKAHIIQEGKH